MNIRRLAAFAATAIFITACGSNSSDSASTTKSTTATPASAGSAADAAPGKGATTIGFIFVGPKDDFGYNQAAYEGSQAVAKKHPELKVLTAENVPEDDNASRVMEKMISDGATIIFATSYGHLDPALKVAAAHPDVAIVQQGNFIKDAVPANVGTYFGTVFEPVFLAGIAAGKATKTNKLGYVYAFPITQTIANINAFELGAKMVNPKAETYVVNTSNWCDPAKQAEAASSLFAQGVDVITQHQDCTATITKAAEEAGKMVVGYHADASALAPKGWVTGSEWAWADLYNEIVETAIAGDFTGSKFNANYRVGYKDGGNPFIQSKYGSMVDDATKTLIADQLKLISTTGSPFTGPVLAQDGSTMFAAGEIPTYADIELKNTKFVQGVVGDIQLNDRIMPHPVHVSDTVPYPWPYDGCINGPQLALVICGAQRQLVDASHDAVAVGDRLDTVAAAVRSCGGQVVWVRHGRREPGSGMIHATHRPSALPTRDTAGRHLAADPDVDDLVVDSIGWDGSFGSELDHLLRSAGIGALVMGGFATEITVDSTVRTLNDRGYECLVLTDGCAPLDVHLGGRAHASLTMSGGIFGALGTSAALLDLIHELDRKEVPA